MRSTLILFAIAISLRASERPKVLIHPPQVPDLVKPLMKRCSDVATFVNGDASDLIPVLKADYLLDNTSGIKMEFSGTLYNKAGEKLMTVKTMRLKTVVDQICGYFEKLKQN